MKTRVTNLGERQAFLDQFRYRHSPDWTAAVFLTVNIKLFAMNKTI